MPDGRSLRGSDLLSVFQLTKEDFQRLFEETNTIRETSRHENATKGINRILATAFFEPSTRTRLSFTIAMEALGGRVIDLGLKERTSIVKGETMSDTIRMLDGYGCDGIVLRHSLEGAAKLAASVSETPVINAGDGSREHPTQALLDLYTMWREFGRIDNLSVGIVGDLKYGRTPSSLLYALSLFEGCSCHLIAPELLQMRESVLSRVEDRVTCHLTDNLERAIPELDVLYVTRIQHERFPDPEEYDRVKDVFQVNAALLKGTTSEAIVMHPLPRTSELSKDVDELPNARYFSQASNGLYARMALLSEIMGLVV